MNEVCTFPDVHVRPRKKRRMYGPMKGQDPSSLHRSCLIGSLELGRRVEQLERNLDSVMNLLSNPSTTSTVGDVQPATPMSASARSTDQTLHSFSGSSTRSHRDVIDQGIISVEQAESLLYAYHDMTSVFPYVFVPQDVSFADFRHEAPMLLHAILVTTSWRNRSLQLVLDREYLSLLSTRLIVEGQKNLDLLQGLLVYVAWCV